LFQPNAQFPHIKEYAMRIWIRVISALAGSLALVLTGMGTANARPGGESGEEVVAAWQCEPSIACMWHDQGGLGESIPLTANNDPHMGPDSDEAHSARNPSGYWLVMWKDENFAGTCISLRPHSYVWDLDTYYGLGDEITSWRFHYPRPPANCPAVP
jgi:hypothetical protein